MKFFELNIATVVLRFYLMMAVVIVGFFSGQSWLALLALPIFLSIMLGIRFSAGKKQQAAVLKTNAKRQPYPSTPPKIAA